MSGASVTITCNHCDWSVTSDVGTAIAASKAHGCTPDVEGRGIGDPGGEES